MGRVEEEPPGRVGAAGGEVGRARSSRRVHFVGPDDQEVQLILPQGLVNTVGHKKLKVGCWGTEPVHASSSVCYR